MKPILLTALALTASAALVDSLITGIPAVAQACGAPACVYDPITHTYIPDPSYVPPTISPATPPKPSVGGVNTPDGPTLGSDTTCPSCTSIPNNYSIPPVLPDISLPDLSPETVPRSTPQAQPSPRPSNVPLPDLSPETVITPQAQPSPRPSSNQSSVTPDPISTSTTQPARPNRTPTNPQPRTTQPQRSQRDNATPTTTVNQGTSSDAPTRNNTAAPTPPTQSLTTPAPESNIQATPAPTPRVDKASPTENRRDILEPQESLTETLTPDPTTEGIASRFWWWAVAAGGGVVALGAGGYQGNQMRRNRIKAQQANAAAALSNLNFNLFSNPPAAKQAVKTPGPLTPKIRMAVQLHRDPGRQRLEAPGGLVDLGTMGAPMQVAAFNPSPSTITNNASSLNVNVTTLGG
ncbi:hypothetical protein VB712_10305 [Spirulina sp. CCNP1310]|uniref:hypothetical protein n=1 Tax=Spirulina sp. CCNP1310 TaxID=3110249 RepID=UPI002B202391|nr:hypothetical protein [Spirulina sp. CCNP1310]MEA5419614.1 hypothetical protein [Spirulina sp. CCNP1310]